MAHSIKKKMQRCRRCRFKKFVDEFNYCLDKERSNICNKCKESIHESSELEEDNFDINDPRKGKVFRLRKTICELESFLGNTEDNVVITDPRKRKLYRLRKTICEIFQGTNTIKPNNTLFTNNFDIYHIYEYLGCNDIFLRQWLHFSMRKNCKPGDDLHLRFIKPLNSMQEFTHKALSSYLNWQFIRVIPKDDYNSITNDEEVSSQVKHINEFLEKYQVLKLNCQGPYDLYFDCE